VGTAAVGVNVTLAANDIGNVAGVAINIAAGLDAIYNPAVDVSQIRLQALATAYTLYGNEQDVQTAMLAVADCGHRVAAPCTAQNGTGTFGYFFNRPAAPPVVATPVWNSAGLHPIQTEGPAIVTGITCPLNMNPTTDINNIINNQNAVFRIGMFNPLIAIDMVNGMYSVTKSASSKIPSSTAAIGSCIRKIARMLTNVGDQMLRNIGMPINYLFNPAAATALSAGNVNIQSAWEDAYDGINGAFNDQTGGQFSIMGSWYSNYNNTYWMAYNAAHTPSTVAIGRIPNFKLLDSGVEWDGKLTTATKSFLTMVLPATSAPAFGFPAAGNPYEYLLSVAPEPSMVLDSLSALNRFQPLWAPLLGKEPMTLGLVTKGGTNINPLAWPVMMPSVGVGMALVLQNYGVINFRTLNAVDTIIDATIPAFDPSVNNDVYLAFFLEAFGYFTRAPILKYNQMITFYQESGGTGTILTDEGSVYASRRAKLGGKKSTN
jgi:hypothetical protein